MVRVVIGGGEGTLVCFEIKRLGWEVASQRRTRKCVGALPLWAVVSWSVVFLKAAEPNQTGSRQA